MSVAFANAFVAGMRYNGVRVDYEPGWQRHGNGQSFPRGQPEGPLTHHTGAPYGGGYSILVHGRSDLRGPLTNICTWPDGHITLIAAHPANHAGAAGGSWARPYPNTHNFNRLTWGNEVMYPGYRPWTAAQYRTARIAAAVVCGIRRRGPEWARGHYETSVTGKWDPGIGNGRAEWFPMDRFRREMATALTQPAPQPPEPTTGGTVIPIALDPTPVPEDWDDSTSWTPREVVINLGYVDGWRGKLWLRFSTMHPGGRIFRAHVDYPDGDEVRFAGWPGAGGDAQWPGIHIEPPYLATQQYAFAPPPGPGTLMLTYAAPNGASLNLEWER